MEATLCVHLEGLSFLKLRTDVKVQEDAKVKRLWLRPELYVGHSWRLLPQIPPAHGIPKYPDVRWDIRGTSAITMGILRLDVRVGLGGLIRQDG